MNGFAYAVAWLLALYFSVYLVGTLTMAGIAALVTRRRQHEVLPSTLRRIMRAELGPRISICVPAYNESTIIADTVRSLLALDYPELEVVVVNDGSTDSTLDVLQREFDLEPSTRTKLAGLPHLPVRALFAPRAPLPLVVVDKENGGRSDAINAALVYARGPLVAILDADGLVANDTLARAIRPFLADPVDTVAAGAHLGIANGCRVVRGRILERRRPRQILPLYQAVEYDRAFRVARVAAGALGAMPIVSGGFGLFRRDALLLSGGLESDTVGEDLDLTLKLHRFFRDRHERYRIAHVPNVVCWTIAPARRRVLGRQRRRWQRGLFQVLAKHRGMAFRPRYGFLGLVAVPWMALFELLGPLVVLAGVAVTLGALAAGVFGLEAVLLAICVTWLSFLVPTLAALLMTEAPGGSPTGWRNLAAVVGVAFVDLPYQVLTFAYRLQTLVTPRRRVDWGEMERSLPREG